MLFALIGREINQRRSALIATLSFLAVVSPSARHSSHSWMNPKPTALSKRSTGLPRTRLSSDTKALLHAERSTHADIPRRRAGAERGARAQEVHRRLSGPGDRDRIESAVSDASDSRHHSSRRRASGQILSDAQARQLQSPLSTRLQRMEFPHAVHRSSPPLEPATPFTDAAVEFQREYTARRRQQTLDGQRRQQSRDARIRHPQFRDVVADLFLPLRRSALAQRRASELRRANQITLTPTCLPSGWVVFDCPPADGGRGSDRNDRCSRTTSPAMAQATATEVSIVLPCLNEADTVGTCVAKAMRALHDAHIAGEVIVADNGSTDGSQAIAAEQGARVVRHQRLAAMAKRSKAASPRRADNSSSWPTRTTATICSNIPKFVAPSARRIRTGARLPSSRGRRARRARRDAPIASLDRKSRFLASDALVVSCADQRRLLRHARLHPRALRSLGDALSGNGIRHRDDSQSRAPRCADERGADHAASRWPQVASAASENIP